MKQRHIGRLVKKIRQKNKITQKELSLLFNTSPQFISRLEGGYDRFPTEYAKIMIKALKVNQSKFVKAFLKDYKERLEVSLCR